MMDPGMLQQIMGQMGGPPAGPPGPPGMPMGLPDAPTGLSPEPGPRDPLGATKTVIQDLHALIATLPDPDHTEKATRALGILTSIQKDLMTKGGNGGY